MIEKTKEAVHNSACEAEDNSSAPKNTEVCSEGDSEKMAAMLAEKEQLLAQCNERVLRLQADFDNFRRRTRMEKEELSGIIAQGVICELLPVLDNFERALGSENQETSTLRTGVEMIYRQLIAALEKMDVKTIQATGEQFNPQMHEAVMRVENAAQPDGLIVEELQKGYCFKGKVIRASMVKVVCNS
ncbi:nucleotide exchange factor GrpE [Lucifera butyrica]|nr:nucleotide exchange factor GrpE [Lucifera butyrica]